MVGLVLVAMVVSFERIGRMGCGNEVSGSGVVHVLGSMVLLVAKNT